MKLADIAVGDTVIWTYHRANHKRYKLADGLQAVVVAKGVEHRYSATTGGWDSRTEYKTSRNGIRIRFLPYTHRNWNHDTQRYDIVEVAENERTTLAAHLQPATPEALAAVAAHQAADVAGGESANAKSDANRRTVMLFAQRGFEVSIDTKGNVTLDAADVERFLAEVPVP